MSKYTVRTEQVTNGWVVWIDLNGQICIRQENVPGKDGFFATETDAAGWGNEHATMLEESYQAGIVEAARKKELEDAQLAALQAQVTQAAALTAILERLTNLSA